MKKLAFLMTAIVIFVASFVAAPTASAAPYSLPSKSTVMSLIPVNLVVEQSIEFSGGRQVTLYYKKSGSSIEIYSAYDLSGYNINDLAGMQATSFRRVSDVKGSCVYRASVTEAAKLIKKIVNTYL